MDIIDPMTEDNTSDWSDRLTKMADLPPPQSRRSHGSSPFSYKNLPMIVSHDPWDAFETVELDPKHLAKNRIMNGDLNQPAQPAFDILRTKLMHALKEHDWNRVAITSPTDGCGKTFVAANLALSLARRDNSKTILMDMDLRNPALAHTLGIPVQHKMRHYLDGQLREHEFMRKIGNNLIVGLNSKAEVNASETLQSTTTCDTLEIMRHELEPDVILYDLPAVLKHDDVLSFLPQVDCVLLVIGGGKTKAADFRKTEKLLGDQVPLLGVILNQDESISSRLL